MNQKGTGNIGLPQVRGHARTESRGAGPFQMHPGRLPVKLPSLGQPSERGQFVEPLQPVDRIQLVKHLQLSERLHLAGGPQAANRLHADSGETRPHPASHHGEVIRGTHHFIKRGIWPSCLALFSTKSDPPSKAGGYIRLAMRSSCLIPDALFCRS
jgi:hypothetical protein